MSRNAPYLISLVVHTGLAAALTVLPLFSEEPLPEKASPPVEVDTLFVVTPLPPAPPPRRAVASVARRERPAAAALPSPEPAPIDPVPAPTDRAVDPTLGGSIGPTGIADAIGRSDGVLGGVMGELPTSAPAPPRVVRISSGLAAPRLVRRVEPVYPPLAAAARVTATVVLEAEVDPRGQVTRVELERVHPLFDAAAVEAVRQWRYEPLLLNGVPTAFVLTVTIRFELKH